MDSDKSLWVLKQPVTKTDVYYNDARLPYFGIDELKGIDFSCIHPDVFYSFFQPLDVESLTEQLDRLIGNAMQKAEMALVSRQSNPDGEDDYEVFDKVKSSAITEVLELIGMKGKSDD